MPGQPGRLVCWFRDFLIGRSIDSAPWLRTIGRVSSRCPPSPPNLPEGAAHRLADNYYCTRDFRRAVTQPVLASSYKQLASAGDELSSDEVSYPQTTTPPTPGQGHKWS